MMATSGIIMFVLFFICLSLQLSLRRNRLMLFMVSVGLPLSSLTGSLSVSSHLRVVLSSSECVRGSCNACWPVVVSVLGVIL